MITYLSTSLFNSRAQTLVNTVNCVGVMGKGIAAEFKRRYPAMFAEYKSICDRKLLEPGKLWLWQGPDQWVLNFPTKRHWRHPSKIEWIEAGLDKFVAQYDQCGIREVAFPRLGCGNGGLDWADVKPLMERYLSKLPIQVYVHDHSVDLGVPEHLEASLIGFPKITDPEAHFGTFDGFLSLLRKRIEQSGYVLSSPATDQFRVELNPEKTLRIEAPTYTAEVSEDDLFGVWIALLNGIVTRDKLAWSAGPAADEMMQILALLPGVRPVEIEGRTSSMPEAALQLQVDQKPEAVV
jgi:O-acetyl-ADP-ribose deacetylase (regulator of RNase III)